jgi:hypothetical protein
LFLSRKGKSMRQKYLISQAGDNNDLTIKEYAVVDKEIKKKSTPIVQEENYSFLCEEIYDGTVIISSISKGQDSLIRTLRTRNLFPIGALMDKIAESVIALYDDDEEQAVELLFDDVEVLEPKPVEG